MKNKFKSNLPDDFKLNARHYPVDESEKQSKRNKQWRKSLSKKDLKEYSKKMKEGHASIDPEKKKELALNKSKWVKQQYIDEPWRREEMSKKMKERATDEKFIQMLSKKVKKGIAEKRTNNQEYRDKIRKLNQAKAKNPKVRAYIKQRTLETQGMKVEVMDPQGNSTIYPSTGEAARLLNWGTLRTNPDCWPKDGSWKEFKMREHKDWKTRRVIDK